MKFINFPWFLYFFSHILDKKTDGCNAFKKKSYYRVKTKRIWKMNAEEFKREVFRHKDKMYRLAKRFFPVKEEAEDIVQEAFLKLWTKRKKLDASKNICSLAMTTVKNLCLDRKKKLKLHFVKADEKAESGQCFNPEDNLNRKDIVEIVEAAAASLTEKQKLIFHLRDVEGMDSSQINEITGFSGEDIRTTLSRARKKIRGILIQQGVCK